MWAIKTAPNSGLMCLLIGVGRTDEFGSPSLRTGQARVAHTLLCFSCMRHYPMLDRPGTLRYRRYSARRFR